MACRVELRERGKSKEDREAAFRKMLAAFRRSVDDAGILTKVKEKSFYESPGEKNRRLKQKLLTTGKKKKKKIKSHRTMICTKKLVNVNRTNHSH